MSFFKKGHNYSKEEIRMNIDLLQELKCNSCKKYMSEPIRQCVQGHSFCNGCIDGQYCRICNSSIISGTNLHLEKIAKKLKYPCRNNSDGCNGMFNKSELDGHELGCVYGQHKCLMSSMCSFAGRREALYAHVQEAHPRELIMSKNNLFTLKKFRDSRSEGLVRLVSAFSDVFWCHHAKDQHSAYWAIQYIGPDIVSEHYTYDLKLHHHEDKGKYVGFKKVSCLKTSDDVPEAFAYVVSCVKIGLDVVETFVNVDGNINCSIKLKKYTPKYKKNNNPK